MDARIKLLDINNPEADFISLFLPKSYKVNFLVFQFTTLSVTDILSNVFEVKWKNTITEHKWNNTGRINHTTRTEACPTGTLLTTNSARNALKLMLLFTKFCMT